MLVLVDLAGADRDSRTAEQAAEQEVKESTAINKSLLALKECLRAAAGAPGALRQPPFRASNLTRLLEDAIAPGAKTKRLNRETVCTMVATVSPSDHIEHMTLNTLRYGQMFAQRAQRGGAKGATQFAFAKKRSDGKAADPKVVAEIRSIYAEFCPDKSEAEVDAILSKFAGKEIMLLGKVRNKYASD